MIRIAFKCFSWSSSIVSHFLISDLFLWCVFWFSFPNVIQKIKCCLQWHVWPRILLCKLYVNIGKFFLAALMLFLREAFKYFIWYYTSGCRQSTEICYCLSKKYKETVSAAMSAKTVNSLEWFSQFIIWFLPTTFLNLNKNRRKKKDFVISFDPTLLEFFFICIF